MTTENKKLGSEWVNVSVSSGTMREGDLIPAFEQVLTEAEVDYSDERPIFLDAYLEDGRENGNPDWLTDNGHQQVSSYLNETLFDLLNDIAPEGCHFGASEGDGADYGFWQTPGDDTDETN